MIQNRPTFRTVCPTPGSVKEAGRGSGRKAGTANTIGQRDREGRRGGFGAGLRRRVFRAMGWVGRKPEIGLNVKKDFQGRLRRTAKRGRKIGRGGRQMASQMERQGPGGGRSPLKIAAWRASRMARLPLPRKTEPRPVRRFFVVFRGVRFQAGKSRQQGAGRRGRERKRRAARRALCRVSVRRLCGAGPDGKGEGYAFAQKPPVYRLPVLSSHSPAATNTLHARFWCGPSGLNPQPKVSLWWRISSKTRR